MASSIQALARRGLIFPPNYVVSNLHYEVLMGSNAYGVSSDNSDQDIYGFCVPPKEILFPHLAGVIQGFGDQGQHFDQYQQPRVMDGETEYDFTIYNIVKYFKLCTDCNPNMIDSLFVPENCVKHATSIGQMVRDNRRLFLSKRAWPRFKGYAYEQVKKLSNKQPTGKRIALVEKFGYDVKFAYHIVRLLDEVEQILSEGDVDLQRNNDQLKAIRRGELTEEQIHDHFRFKLVYLERAAERSTLPERPDEAAIKQLLINCLEAHYGNLKDCVVKPDATTSAMAEVARLVDQWRAHASNRGSGETAEGVPGLQGSGSGCTLPDPRRVHDAGSPHDQPVRPSKLAELYARIRGRH